MLSRLKGVRGLDWPLLAASCLLMVLGLIVLFAINFKDPSLSQDFSPVKQLIHGLVGLGLLAFFARLDYRLWSRLGKYWYGAGIVLLLLVALIGKEAQGSVRALDLGFIQFQPTEFIKIGVIMVLGSWFISKAEQMNKFGNLAVSIAMAIVPAALIAAQPDLGSAIVVLWLWLLMVFLSQAKRLHLGGILLAGLLAIPLLMSQLQPYQADRIESFINPQADPQGAGYNVVQSMIAVGSGQLLGKGLGAGTQSQLNFIPSQHTDFIFAVTSEKLGLLGGGLVLFLFGVILTRALLIAKRSEDRFSQMLAIGIAGMFFIHVVVNIGMNLGIMPVTGIPLPLMSYGGTNLIISLIAIGILQSIHLHKPNLQF